MVTEQETKFSCFNKQHILFNMDPVYLNTFQDARILSILKQVIGDTDFFTMEAPFSYSRLKRYVNKLQNKRWSFVKKTYCDFSSDNNLNNNSIDDIFNTDETSLEQIEKGLYLINFCHIKTENPVYPKLVFVNEDGLLWDTAEVRSTLHRLAKTMVETVPSHSEINPAAFDGLFYADNLLNDIRADFEKFLDSKELYKNMNQPWKRGYVFVGGSGAGKTSLIRSLCKYYGIDSRNITEYIDPSGNLRSFSSRKLYLDYKLFHTKHDIVAILLEDIDKFTAYQSAGVHKDMPKLSLQTLLNGIDGVDAQDGIILLATSNNPGSIAESLLARPGRFDRVWTFNNPGPEEIISLLKYRKIEISDGTLEQVSKELKGFSMAFIDEFAKSVKMIYCKPVITFDEAKQVLNRIHMHKELYERHFTNETKQFGFHSK
ncbi:MAG: ATP-binding protein [Fibrobacteres bacterium]|nr:ATP-binding protein [Fibrobacterota bacterium]